jgi:DNA-directed RNA polymerase specialized sigma24 family protein
MRAFICKMRQPDFDPARPLAIVYHIARLKGLDQLRARNRSKTLPAESDFLEAAAQALKGSDTGVQWRLLSTLQRKEFQETVLDIIQTLPERQKLVAACYVECFEEILEKDSYLSLAELVSSKTRRPETVATVKSNWHAARKKIAEELHRRGFEFIHGE